MTPFYYIKAKGRRKNKGKRQKAEGKIKAKGKRQKAK